MMLQYFLFFKRVSPKEKETYPKRPFQLIIQQKGKPLTTITFYVENNTFLESTTEVRISDQKHGLEILPAEQPKRYTAITIGRKPKTGSDIYPIILTNTPTVSRQHGTIRLIEDAPYYQNDGQNGSLVDNVFLQKKIRIKKLVHGSIIRLGEQQTQKEKVYNIEIEVKF